MPGGEMVVPRQSDVGAAVSRSPGHRAPLFTLNDLLWLLYLYPLRLLSALTPPAWVHRFGTITQPLFQFQAREARKRATRRILAMRPGATPAEAARIARQCISNDMFRQLDDLVLLRPSHRQKLRCTGIEGIQNVDRAMAAGNGVILLTLHFCATRIALRHLAELGYPALTVQNQAPRSLSEGRLGTLLGERCLELRLQGIHDIVYLQDAECSLKVLRRLRSGGLVHLHMDGLNSKTVVEGTFLGVPWRFPAGAFDLVRLAGCAVVPMLCLGRSTGFRILFSPMLGVVKASSRAEFLNANLPVFTEALERQIADHPGEWRGWTWQ
jgi:lauroyl/myristoyl acyltransferase